MVIGVMFEWVNLRFANEWAYTVWSADAENVKDQSPLDFYETVMEMNKKVFFEFNGKEHTRSVYM